MVFCFLGFEANRQAIESADRGKQANHIELPLPASAGIDRACEARRGWMSERLKESVLKTEVLIGIPGVRIPLHPLSLEVVLSCLIER